ncbi:LPS-assembly protein LptD [Roseovarius pelagicus]|uniref:LPS-assembly protein LptD n=1 Tax=Roseovarius pelagicus TaxID=2980108 RepID=A0ABY6DCD4_9RHOB|nr:LPS assembly protein LptD [Roseovarius pelagicus]UXX83753.1 LPS assembly protein LptD [Roseovarius pelagicus]
MTPTTRLFCALIMVWLFVSGTPATAQTGADDTEPQPAMLIADDVYIRGDDTLVAEGNVEAVYDGQRLTARRITYDKATDSLEFDGPITLFDGGYTVVLADSAQLDRNLQNGILFGARIVMDDQLQLAAQQMNRTNGRYSQLYKAAVTSCHVCKNGQAPLWQIRARRIIHDQQSQQFYLDDAQFRVFDTPIFYLPHLRLPDPTLERSTGFLIPSIYNSSLLGFGVKVPYFIKIGDHKDLTLTPWLSNKTRTMEFRYRQAFQRGEIEFEGALSNDDLNRTDNRAYIFGRGLFEMQNDFILRFDIEAVNDDAYLVDYDFSDKDRLDSELSLERVRRDEWMRGAVTHFHTLRAGESNSTLPTIVGNADYERRIYPARFGGELRYSAQAHTHYRSSSLSTDGPDFDVFADGRDVNRLSTSADWLRSWTMLGGVRSTFQTGIAVDHFEIKGGGATSRASLTDVIPSTALTLRLPLAKVTNKGVAHVIEPVVQLGWVGGSTPSIANDESTRTEFDEGNLLSLSRFAAKDRRERGASAAYGLSWSRFDPGGLTSTFTVGQILRDRSQREPNGGLTFSDTSGLRGEFSDVLFAGQITTQNGLTLTGRGLFDTAFDTTKAEARASWQNSVTNIGATYVWLDRDVAENRPTTISEWAFDGSYRMSRHWTGSAEWRYDVASDRSVKAGVGVTYTNECVDIALSASRRFTSSTILTPSTDISLTVGLRGFSARTEDKSYARTCRN